jgi:hypothetical protein
MDFYDYTDAPIGELLGKTLVAALNKDNNELHLVATDGNEYAMYHRDDCCESVRIEEIIGDLQDLVGSPIIEAEEATNENEWPQDGSHMPESFTWTFYKLGTAKGFVTIRWLGTSNGYYSERVDFVRKKTSVPTAEPSF